MMHLLRHFLGAHAPFLQSVLRTVSYTIHHWIYFLPTLLGRFQAPSPTQAEQNRRNDAEYLFQQAQADQTLCEQTPQGLELRKEVRYYGCPYCQTTDHERYYSALGSYSLTPYTYVRCRSCELVYPWPRLNREALAQRVNDTWMTRFLAESFKHVPYWPHFKPVRQDLFRALAGKRVLEVGPGTGQVLDYLRAIGADAIGVEPNAVAAKHCQERGLPVLHASFDETLLDHAEMRPGFDAVLFLESVYHLFDLKEALQIAHRLLRGPDSRLILKAFDIDSFSIRYLKPASLGIDGLSIPTNASARTYARLLEQSGFYVKQHVRWPESVFAHMGIDSAAIQSKALYFFYRAQGWFANKLLKTLGKTRNFVLVAEKKC